MAGKFEFRVKLRLDQDTQHVQVLDAVSRRDAIAKARADAVDLGGGPADAWRVEICEQLTGPIVRRAA